MRTYKATRITIVEKAKVFFFATLFGLVLLTPKFNFAQDSELKSSTTIKSEILNESRPLLISLPPDYNETQEKYPVHYVLDGELTFDYYAAMINLMSLQGSVPRAIVVGVVNISRDRDFYPKGIENGNDEAFTGFVEKELIPYINKNYRTANFRVIAGHSLAGLYVINTLLNHPNLFSAYIAGSPYLDPITSIASNSETWSGVPPKKFLYVSSGSLEDKGLLNNQKTLGDALRKIKGQDLYYSVEIHDGKNHNTNGLVNFLDGNLFIFTRFGQYKLPSDPSKFDVEDLYNYTKQLSAEYGFPVNIPENFLMFIGNEMIKFKRYNDTKRVAEIIQEQFPTSMEGHKIMVKVYRVQGMEDEAVKLEQKYNLK